MTLTTDDLQAIKGIVDDAVEVSMQQTAAGFAEVHAKIGNLQEDMQIVKEDLESVKGDLESVKGDLESVKSTVGRIELVQRAEVARVDRHGQDIAFFKQKFAKA